MIAVSLLFASLPLLPEEPSKRRLKTEVDGSRYKIVVRGDQVEVLNLAILTGRTMVDRDRRRIAVRQATGCNITDEMWFDAKMIGTLTCPSK